MKEETSNTEQSILKAAEKEFLKKGFSGSKTTEIAKESPGIDASSRYLTGTHKKVTRSRSSSPRITAIMIPIIFKMIKRICNTILSSPLFF